LKGQLPTKAVQDITGVMSGYTSMAATKLPSDQHLIGWQILSAKRKSRYRNFLSLSRRVLPTYQTLYFLSGG
jgi:hypothetical protein